MWCIAICHDGDDASRARTAQFQAHVAHNVAHIGRFLLTGVLARADGVTQIENDPRLSGSFYCLDVEDLAKARALMQADPFTKGAWAWIDYFEWQKPKGLWLADGSRPSGLRPDFGCYVAASRGNVEIADALMSGAVVPLASTGDEPEDLATITLLRAPSMTAAEARVPDAAWIAAIPVAIGRWVNIGSAAQLAAARG